MILVAADLSQLEGWVRLQALPDARQRGLASGRGQHLDPADRSARQALGHR